MTKRNGMRIVFALALGTLLLAGQAFAITTCGKEALNGTYGFQIAGTTGDKADHVAGYGWMEFDGVGRVSDGYSAVSIAGAKAVEAKELSGTYTVAADCTFTVKVDRRGRCHLQLRRRRPRPGLRTCFSRRRTKAWRFPVPCRE